MGQTNLKRSQFNPRVTVTTPQNDDKQFVDFTGYFEIGDVVDVIDEDVNGNITSVLADNLTVLAINPNVALTLSSAVDTTLALGTPKIYCQQIDDGQDAVDRLYRRKHQGEVEFIEREDILDRRLNFPSAGKTTYYVANTSFWRAGDTADILADEGLVASGVIIDSVNPNADAANNRSTIVITTLVDTSTFTNPLLLNRTITAQSAIRRNQERIDGIDQPVENEDLGVGDGSLTAWEMIDLYVQHSTKLTLDGRRLKKGTAGTRAFLTQGAGNAQLIYTSMILGTDGNKTRVAVTAGAGIVVTITGNFASGYNISVTNNAGAATAVQIANALNAHAVAKRLVQVQYGGDGSGIPATFVLTFLASGLNDGTGDYAEIPQIFENLIVTTGFKWISLHIRPNERNRLNTPPQDDEELVIDYRQAGDNIDY
jgi:hypothetical protein